MLWRTINGSIDASPVSMTLTMHALLVSSMSAKTVFPTSMTLAKLGSFLFYYWQVSTAQVKHNLCQWLWSGILHLVSMTLVRNPSPSINDTGNAHSDRVVDNSERHSDIKLIWNRTYLIPNLWIIQLVIYQTYEVTNLPHTEFIRYWTY